MAMQVKTRVTTNNAAMRAVNSMQNMRVLVGIPATGASRAPSSPGLLANNAAIGYLQEFGNPATNLPARPHLVPGVRRILPQATTILRQGLAKELANVPNGMVQALNIVGLLAQNSVRGLIAQSIPPPLALRTIMNRLYRRASYIAASPARKKAMAAKWVSGTFIPLIDTGQYRNSITYVIRRK